MHIGSHLPLSTCSSDDTHTFLSILGQDITRVLLEEYKPFFSPIIVLTRSASSLTAKSLAAGGAVIREVDLSGNATTDEQDKKLRESLSGVDVLIDTLTHYVEPAKLRVFKAALDAGVKVYFPSEFGVYVIPPVRARLCAELLHADPTGITARTSKSSPDTTTRYGSRSADFSLSSSA